MTQPIRLGLIGCGGIVQRSHISGYLLIGEKVRVAALADVVADNLAAVAGRLGIPADQQYLDYREMLAHAALDAVTIATPHHLHAEQAIQAAQAGLHVISEKPMATSLEEADTILAAVTRHGVSYGVVHNFLFSPGMRRALNLLPEIGYPRFGRAKSLFSGREANPTDPALIWRFSKAAGGGCLNDTAYHEIYLVETLVGSPVRYVEGRVRTMFYDKDVDDLALLLFEHENGALSTVSTSWGVQGSGAGETGNLCEVHSGNEVLRVVSRGRSLYRYRIASRRWIEIGLDHPESKEIEQTTYSGHAGYFDATFTALAAGEPLPISGQQARHNLAIIHAARQATVERRAIEVTEYVDDE